MKSLASTNKLLLFFIVAGLLFSCATVVTPTGGPKDETPPALLRSEPLNYSAGFHGDRLVLGFSEFIELKDMEKYLLVSPPLSKDPEFRIKGKSLILKLDDSLRENTTYSFYFGDAIVDITERNPCSNFSFAFSTGAFIDSLSLKGVVTDAYTRMPVKDALVMLYTDQADSVPLKQRPVYVSRSGESGTFTLNSLAAGRYRMVALKDGNNDYLYNPPGEIIGFSDSLVEPYYIPARDGDTSLHISRADYPMISLDVFPEPDSTQKLLKGVMTAPHTMTMFFRYPLLQPEFRVLNLDSVLTWSMWEASAGNDTLTFWLNNNLPDSLSIRVKDRGQVLDTLVISTFFKPRTSEKGRNQPVADTSLKFNYSAARNRILEWGSPYMLQFPTPLQTVDTSGILLIRRDSKDTLRPAVIVADSIRRRARVDFDWKTMEEYELLFPKGSFTDIYGNTNDTVRSVFRVRPRDEYGQFRVNVMREPFLHPLIVQLLNEKGVMLQSQTLKEPGKVDFGFLMPAKYGLKVIYDENANGRWDTGVFLKHRQPERTAVHPKVFEVRGNWELEEEWKL